MFDPMIGLSTNSCSPPQGSGFGMHAMRGHLSGLPSPFSSHPLFASHIQFHIPSRSEREFRVPGSTNPSIRRLAITWTKVQRESACPSLPSGIPIAVCLPSTTGEMGRGVYTSRVGEAGAGMSFSAARELVDALPTLTVRERLSVRFMTALPGRSTAENLLVELQDEPNRGCGVPFFFNKKNVYGILLELKRLKLHPRCGLLQMEVIQDLTVL